MRNLQFSLWFACLAMGQAPVSPPSAQPAAAPFRCSEQDILWAGMVCSATEPCPVYLEISAVESAGDRIFAAGNIHSSAITLYSELLASDDGGHTWREAHERIRGAALDRIQFVGTEYGWIGGQSLSPLVQDPFLLVTTDAGKNWRRQDVFGETRVGALLEFYFSDRNEGRLLFDRGRGAEGGRYQVYESHDGGVSWAIREESGRLPRLEESPPPPRWRVGADGPTRSFHLERRSGGAWSRVAALAIELGDCKPAGPAAGEEAK
jgi:hypothetical protein